MIGLFENAFDCAPSIHVGNVRVLCYKAFKIFYFLKFGFFFILKESSQPVKIVSVNNPLVFLNAKKFYANILEIIHKEWTCPQQLSEDMTKVRSTY